jgi:HAD superfamily hydrolase (TIGR01509 family)
MTPAAIIFDFDGVIADSESVSSRSFSAALCEAGLPTTVEEAMDRYTGLTREDTLAAISAYWGERTPHDIADRLARHADAAFAQGIAPVPGVKDFIASAAHLPLAIGSSSRTAYLHAHLATFGLSGRFGAHVYSGREHVTRGKPHPDIYLHAAASLGVRPEDTVIIEDSPIGARAAVASGARVIGLCAGSHVRPSLAAVLSAEGVTAVLHSYDEVADYLGIGVVTG